MNQDEIEKALGQLADAISDIIRCPSIQKELADLDSDAGDYILNNMGEIVSNAGYFGANPELYGR